MPNVFKGTADQIESNTHKVQSLEISLNPEDDYPSVKAVKDALQKGGAGTNGKSAYEIAVDNGFEGTEVEWLESLNGTSITIKNIAESTADGGDNIINFSDGNSLTVKNGNKGSNGSNGYTPVKGVDYFTESDKQTIVNDVVKNINGIPSYWQDDLDKGVKAINTAMLEAGQNKSAFLFYTDAHWTWSAKIAPKLLKYLYEHTGMNKTIYGGDVVSQEIKDTVGEDDQYTSEDYDTMSYLWEWRNALKGLPNHHSVVGNHDDGNGDKEDVDENGNKTYSNSIFTEQNVYGFLLAAEETPDIVRDDGGLYYYIDNPSEKTRYLYLDTAYQGATENQQAFVKNALLTTPNNWHIIPIAHIWYSPDYELDDRPITIKEMPWSPQTLCDIFDNYNIKKSDDFADFSNCGAKIEFCIGGHVHRDYVGASNGGIPIIILETAGSGTRGEFGYSVGDTTESAVNGIIADYDKGIIKVIRVGRGNSFDVYLQSGETTTYYSVTNNLSGVTSSSKTIRVKENEAFETTLSASVDGDMTVVVTMGGINITDSVYDADTGVISIAQVTGNIVIKAIVVNEEDTTYINVLPLAIDTDGSVYNGVGYKQNMRWSDTSNDFKDADGDNWDVTGYIPVKRGDILRFKNITWQDGSYSRMNIYNANFEKFSEGIYSSLVSNTGYETITDDNSNITQLTIPNWNDFADIAYVRIGCQDLDATSIITINQEISSNSYTNQIPISTDTDGFVFNGVGYQEGKRIKSSGVIIDEDGYNITGFIPFKFQDVLYISSDIFTPQNKGSCNVVGYDSNKNFIPDAANYVDNSYGAIVLENGIYEFNLSNLTEGKSKWQNVAYVRVTGANITENSIITVNEEIPNVSYTNVLDTVGYVENCRLSGSTGQETTNEGTCVTGYIPCTKGATVYMKNVIAPMDDNSNSHYHYMAAYDSNYNHLGGYSILHNDGYKVVSNDGENITAFIAPDGTDYTNMEYIRIGVQDINENSIITINEPIE